MPAGVTWGVYLSFVTAAMLTMFAGAQCVHLAYRPMDDLQEYVEMERQRRLAGDATRDGPPGSAEQEGL